MADKTFKLTFNVGDRVFLFKAPLIGEPVPLPTVVEVEEIEFIPIIRVKDVLTGEISNVRPVDLRGRAEVTDHFNKMNDGLADKKLVDAVTITKTATAGDIKPIGGGIKGA